MYRQEDFVNEQMDSSERSHRFAENSGAIAVESRLTVLEIRHGSNGNSEKSGPTEPEPTVKSEAIEDGDWNGNPIVNLDDITFITDARRGDVGHAQDVVASQENRTEAEPKPILACPFFKHDPERYQEDKHCAYGSWHEAHRVKEHLMRRHKLSHHICSRCGSLYEKVGGLLQHGFEGNCEMRALNPDEIDNDKRGKLRSKERPANGRPTSEEDKWMRIYQILFPSDDIAVVSPYADLRQYISDEDLIVELKGILHTYNVDAHAEDNIIFQFRSVLRGARLGQRSNVHTPDSFMAEHPERQNSHESDLQNPRGATRPGPSQGHGMISSSAARRGQLSYLRQTPVDRAFGTSYTP